MKKAYTTPELWLFLLSNEDVIATSEGLGAENWGDDFGVGDGGAYDKFSKDWFD